jgi:hypothetical protein
MCRERATHPVRYRQSDSAALSRVIGFRYEAVNARELAEKLPAAFGEDRHLSQLDNHGVSLFS